jgi:hypothetical protein
MDKTEALKILEDLIAGHKCAIAAEEAVISAFEVHATAFHEGDRTNQVMRRLRVYNEAKSNVSRWSRESLALTIASEVLHENGD